MLGHEVRLMPPAYVKPYVKRGKTDRADAEAIAEAVTRPTMRFVPIKSADRQAALLDHKARDFMVRQHTQTVNAIRAHIGEFGIVVAKGIQNVDRLLDAARGVPEAARPALDLLADQLCDLRGRIDTVTERIEIAQSDDRLARRLATLPSIGRISKAGNRYLRRLLYLGAMAKISARRRREPCNDWLGRMLERKPVKVVAVALANRMARIVWALISTGDIYRATAA